MTLRSLPNFLTFCRLFSAPVVVWLIIEPMPSAAFWLFVATALTDIVDGRLAKYLNAQTAFGALLDPLADKALVIGAYVSLGFLGQLPNWLVIMVVFRDILIIGGVITHQLVAGDIGIGVKPLGVSKLNTAAQAVLASVVLAGPGLGLDVKAAVGMMIVIVATTVLSSGAAYLLVWWRAASPMMGGRL
ncbi:MAG: CDP-alcohol phosphatidyltransferase family protein [Alphaproteobacteria bacterium]